MRNTSLKLLTAAAFLVVASSASFAASETTGQYIDDTTITTKVKAAIVADNQLSAMQVSVKTSQGTVMLSGMVDTKSEESEAIKVANQIDGVKDVKDFMTVRGVQND